MRILVIEDEPGIAHFIRQGLSEAGYAVDVTQDGQAGLEYALTATYDVIILDLLLPKMDGLHVLSTLRDCRCSIPILVLTARDTVEDRVQGLDRGADDYLVKPFAFSELLARLRALLRRPPLQAQIVLRVCVLEFDTARREVRRAGRRIDLSPRELSLLEYFMRHPGQVMTRTQIAETEFKITSSITTFTPGISYHFVITNNGQTTHEFMLMPKSEGNMNGMTMGDMDALAPAKVQNIAPGQTVTLDYTFPSSAAGSHPEFACYQPGHYKAGMKLEVTVGS